MVPNWFSLNLWTYGPLDPLVNHHDPYQNRHLIFRHTEISWLDHAGCIHPIESHENVLLSRLNPYVSAVKQRTHLRRCHCGSERCAKCGRNVAEVQGTEHCTDIYIYYINNIYLFLCWWCLYMIHTINPKDQASAS